MGSFDRVQLQIGMTKKLNHIIYWAYNSLGAILLIFVLSWLTMYFNGNLIPNRFRWDSDGKLRANLIWDNISHFIVMNLEAAIFVCFFYFLNKLFVTYYIQPEGSSNLAFRTSLGLFILLFLISIVLFAIAQNK